MATKTRGILWGTAISIALFAGIEASSWRDGIRETRERKRNEIVNGYFDACPPTRLNREESNRPYPQRPTHLYADFNGDGREDIVSYSPERQRLIYTEGRENYLFGSGIVVARVDDCISMYVTDVNGDGEPDIFVIGGQEAQYFENVMGR